MTCMYACRRRVSRPFSYGAGVHLEQHVTRMTCVDNFETLHACTCTQVTLVQIVQDTVVQRRLLWPLNASHVTKLGMMDMMAVGSIIFQGKVLDCYRRMPFRLASGSTSIPGVCLLESTVRRRRQVKANWSLLIKFF